MTIKRLADRTIGIWWDFAASVRGFCRYRIIASKGDECEIRETLGNSRTSDKSHAIYCGPIGLTLNPSKTCVSLVRCLFSKR
jgi:hypothetical protein